MQLVRAVADGTVDHHGQRVATKLMTGIIAAGTALAVVVGTCTRRFEDMVKIQTVFAAVALVVSVPSWPVYRRYRHHFRPSTKEE